MKLLPFVNKKPLVSVLRFEGIIQSSARMRSSSLSDAAMAALIERAFKKGKPRAVAVVVNSPGGSPVQSSMIGARIRRMSTETKTPVYAFVEDLAASGGYWIAAAADSIFVDSCSIVGSIGVISSSFGFHGLLGKSGIERRLYTSGEEKSLLDPFLPQKPEDVVRLREVQSQIHEAFIDHVKACRGQRLKSDDLFTGRFWLGQQAVELGLVDGIGHLGPKMKEMFGEKVKFRNYARKRKFIPDFGAQISASVISDFEERAARARFGC